MLGFIRVWLEKRRARQEKFTKLIEDIINEGERKAEWKKEEWQGMTAEEIAYEMHTNILWREKLKEAS